jgi:hypothetical protein
MLVLSMQTPRAVDRSHLEFMRIYEMAGRSPF